MPLDMQDALLANIFFYTEFLLKQACFLSNFINFDTG